MKFYYNRHLSDTPNLNHEQEKNTIDDQVHSNDLEQFVVVQTKQICINSKKKWLIRRRKKRKGKKLNKILDN